MFRSPIVRALLQVLSWPALVASALGLCAALVMAVVLAWDGLATATLQIPALWRFLVPGAIIAVIVGMFLHNEMDFEHWWTTAISTVLTTAALLLLITIVLIWLGRLDAQAVEWMRLRILPRWPRWVGGFAAITILALPAFQQAVLGGYQWLDDTVMNERFEDTWVESLRFTIGAGFIGRWLEAAVRNRETRRRRERDEAEEREFAAELRQKYRAVERSKREREEYARKVFREAVRDAALITAREAAQRAETEGDKLNGKIGKTIEGAKD